MQEKRKSSKRMRKWHKWLGLIFAFFFIMFSLSGILLNHRQAISTLDIPRSILPDDYSYQNWNNGSVKGTFVLGSDSILMYGGSGIWLTDTCITKFEPFISGMQPGMDNRITSSIVATTDGGVFAATTFGLYRLNRHDNNWHDLSPLIDNDERLTDLIVKGDSLVLLSRSHIYVAVSPYRHFEKVSLTQPEGYKREASLFRTLWTLHSGELFGLGGQLFVDMLGVVGIILSVTGIMLTLYLEIIKRRKKKQLSAKSQSDVYRVSLKWHNKPGVWLFFFFMILVLSGTFLRPPFLIAIIRAKVPTIPGTMLHKPNVWHDKLRTLRYDTYEQDWILYTSDGFFTLKDFDSIPVKMANIPPISVMGVTVMDQIDTTKWIAGSFSGIYYWNRQTGESLNAYTMRKDAPRRPGPPSVTNAVSGYSAHFGDKQVVFDYSKGARLLHSNDTFMPMPELLKKGRMSLWHLCLEVHVGRIYAPVLGVVTDLFIFLSGVVFTIILISGWIVYRRRYKKRNQLKNT